MKSVFLLLHSYELEECEQTKTIGIYSTKEKAEKVVEEFKNLPGFKDHPDCFYIAEYQIDKSQWEDGFITLYPGAE